MSDILLTPMSGDLGRCTAAHPRSFTGSFTAEEMSFCYVVVDVAEISAGITALNPATITWETSFDNGEEWHVITGTVIDPITANGKVFARLTGDTTIVGPMCRITVTPPAGETLVVESVIKSRVTDLIVFRSSALATSTTTGAVITEEVKQNVIASLRIDYGITPVTTLAWTTVFAATAAAIDYFDIFDSSGETLELGIGAAGLETRIGYVLPGGCRIVNVVPVGSRISLRAVSANATVGEFTVNAFG